MISNVNEKPVTGALCLNCKAELNSMVVETNKGKQTLYVCVNENCKLRNSVTIGYFPPPENAPTKNA